MIISILALALTPVSPGHATQNNPQTAPVQLAGLFGIGKQKGFTEIVQKVQDERDYAPQVGRQPERNPEPLVSVRYLTPEQRAEPIIVDPAPIYVSADDGAEGRDQSAPRNNDLADAQTADAPAPSYITSTPSATASEAIPSGSATGSSATADYGTPG